MWQKKRQPKLIEFLAVIMYAITMLDNPGMADDNTNLISQNDVVQLDDCDQGDDINENERLAEH